METDPLGVCRGGISVPNPISLGHSVKGFIKTDSRDEKKSYKDGALEESVKKKS